MSTVGAGMVIDAIPLAPPRVSLLTSVDVQPQSDPHWANGLEWLPEGCTPPDDPYWWACPDTGGIAPDYTKVVPDPEAIVRYRPFTVWLGFKCGNQGLRNNDHVRRAERAMEAFQSYLIEQELHDGIVAQAASFDNDYLTLNPTLLNSGSNTGYARALAELEQGLSTCQPGQVGVIHAQPRVVTLWVQNGLVTPEPNGRRLRTALGTIVVPGAGYSGKGAALAGGGTVASSYAYATGMVRVLLGPVERPTTEADEPGQTHGIDGAEVTRSVNTVNVRVERAVAAVWDECCQLGVRVDLTQAH